MSVSALSTGQRKAIKAIVGNNPNHAVTYKEAAESLGISEWALKTHLQRIRKKNPRLYQSHMDKRRLKLQIRHEYAEARQDEHRHAWLYARRRSENRMLRLLGLGDLIARW